MGNRIVSFLGKNPRKISNLRLAQKTGLTDEESLVTLAKYRNPIIETIINSAGCLCFLDQKKGTIKAPLFQFPGHVKPSLKKVEEKFLAEKGYQSVKWDFEEGKVSLKKSNKKIVTIRIGKYLNQLLLIAKRTSANKRLLYSSQVSNALYYWENRELAWDWRISTSPKDLLTVSTNRAWSSCFRFSDYAMPELCTFILSGAAILFFERNGQVCGRRMLLPLKSRGRPSIYIDDLYGSGPSTERSHDLVKELLKEEPLCSSKIRCSEYWNKSYENVLDFSCSWILTRPEEKMTSKHFKLVETLQRAFTEVNKNSGSI